MDNDEKANKKPKGTVGGGRAPGQKNRNTLIGKNVQDTFRNFLGLDDEAVVRTGRIDRVGYGARVRLQQMFDGIRTPDPAYTNLMKLGLAYAYGTARRMEPPVSTRKSIAFIGRNGLPWSPENDPMRDQERAALEAQKAERLTERQAREAQAEDAIVVKKVDSATDAGETLEAVNLPEPEPPSEYRR
jgi:hypothetical protein